MELTMNLMLVLGALAIAFYYVNTGKRVRNSRRLPYNLIILVIGFGLLSSGYLAIRPDVGILRQELRYEPALDDYVEVIAYSESEGGSKTLAVYPDNPYALSRGVPVGSELTVLFKFEPDARFSKTYVDALVNAECKFMEASYFGYRVPGGQLQTSDLALQPYDLYSGYMHRDGYSKISWSVKLTVRAQGDHHFAITMPSYARCKQRPYQQGYGYLIGTSATYPSSSLPWKVTLPYGLIQTTGNFYENWIVKGLPAESTCVAVHSKQSTYSVTQGSVIRWLDRVCPSGVEENYGILTCNSGYVSKVKYTTSPTLCCSSSSACTPVKLSIADAGQGCVKPTCSVTTCVCDLEPFCESGCSCDPDCVEYCGNGRCGVGETASTCAKDCSLAGCGDGRCQSTTNGESCSTCPSDCICEGNEKCEPSGSNSNYYGCVEKEPYNQWWAREICGKAKTCDASKGMNCETCPSVCGACGSEKTICSDTTPCAYGERSPYPECSCPSTNMCPYVCDDGKRPDYPACRCEDDDKICLEICSDGKRAVWPDCVCPQAKTCLVPCPSGQTQTYPECVCRGSDPKGCEKNSDCPDPTLQYCKLEGVVGTCHDKEEACSLNSDCYKGYRCDNLGDDATYMCVKKTIFDDLPWDMIMLMVFLLIVLGVMAKILTKPRY